MRRRLCLAVAALIAAGYGLTLAIFYPGIMTFDAKFVHEDIARGVFGDWQSPVMTVLWGVIDPLAPGPGSMFLLIATSYWLGFGLLAFLLARRSSRLALLLPLLALMPSAFVLVGIIWRDVLFATTWLLAAVIAFAAAERGAARQVVERHVHVSVSGSCASSWRAAPSQYASGVFCRSADFSSGRCAAGISVGGRPSTSMSYVKRHIRSNVTAL